MELDTNLSELTDENLTSAKDELEQLASKEVVRRELLESVDAKVRRVIGLKRETNNLVIRLKRDISNL